jgi:hypothetical protein
LECKQSGYILEEKLSLFFSLDIFLGAKFENKPKLKNKNKNKNMRILLYPELPTGI